MRRVAVLLTTLLVACSGPAPRAPSPPFTSFTLPPRAPTTTPPTTTPPTTSSMVTGTPTPRVTPTQPPTLGPGVATVDVAVATVWRSPSSPRPVDAPALADPVRIRPWLQAMTLDQRRGLSGRADTQVLLGERVRVLAVVGGWARVVVPGQPTPLDARGYPGWVPVRQLTAAPPATGTPLTVASATAWLRTPAGRPLLEVSLGTRLDAVGRSGADWKVRLPDGRAALVVAADGVRGPLAEPVVATARRFLGLGYLWAGPSGFGFDCSGLVEVVYRAHGITVPRDADAQALGGRPVSRAQLVPGDLVSLAASGTVHHVGLYAGNGQVLDAPQTGSSVRLLPLTSPPWSTGYSGARRYLP
ncbi:MAG: C40 family peptidase [Nocardioidaceae bacterium]